MSQPVGLERGAPGAPGVPLESAGSAGGALAFCALALYGTLRWGTMLEGSEQGRLFLSLLLSLAAAVLTRKLAARPRLRWALVPLAILAVIALVGIAGFPLSLHVRRVASHLSDGVGTFGNLLVPYNGTDPNVAAALVLGAGLLLLCAGAVFGTVRRSPDTGRLALAAVPLAALAVVPSTIVAPQVSYLHGLLTFGLVALLVFSPRLAPDRRGSAFMLLALAGVVGAVGAGLIAGHRLWVDVPKNQPLAGTGSGTGVGAESFDWQQTYSTLGWPYTGASVLEITARRPALWKAEDLDTFNGRAWSVGGPTDDVGLEGVSATHLAAYSETLSVNVDQIVSDQFIAAGYAERPQTVGVAPGADAGTWVSSFPLRSGADYAVRVYDPHPPAAQLAAAGTDYPQALAPFRTLNLPANVYSGVQALARRLASGADTPYGDVEAVLNYLQHGYVYTLDPPNGGSYPLVDFLLHSRRGYCQAFAGAMALLLRMQGVPARVAVGFSSGQRRADSHIYVVADQDAHAWVEVWFPSFGWVAFDPTPGTATAAGSSPVTTLPRGAVTSGETGTVSLPTTTQRRPAAPTDHLAGGHGTGSGAGAHAKHGSGPGTTLLIIALGLLGLLGATHAAALARGFWRRPSTADLTDELDRAFAVCGQPLGADVTLAALARRLSDSPAAAAYVGSLGAARYRSAAGPPSARGRAALRRWLAHGGGPGARWRALRALPPRRQPTSI